MNAKAAPDGYTLHLTTSSGMVNAILVAKVPCNVRAAIQLAGGKKQMKIYGSSRSPFVRKAMVVAHEAGVAGRIEKIPVVVSSTLKPTAEVMMYNPLNKIPTLLTDEGITLFESVVVCEYLDTTFNKGAKLFPASGMARWKALCSRMCSVLPAGLLHGLFLVKEGADTVGRRSLRAVKRP